MDTGDTAPPTSIGMTPDAIQAGFAAIRKAETETPVVAEEQAPETEAPEAPETTETPEVEPAKEKVRFKIGDEEVDEDTLIEWKKSGLRQADYTKKTQEVSAKAQKLEQERAAERADTLKKWQALEDAVASVTPKEPNWAALQAQVRDGALPQEDYNRFAADWLAQQQQREAIAEERRKAEEAVRADQSKEAEATAKRNYERVLDIIPEWRDADQRMKDFQDIVAYGQTMGVDEKILMGLPPEGFKMARDAAAYHKLQQNTGKPKVVKVDSATLKPGASVSSVPKTSEVESASRRLAQTHSDEDAVLAFRALRKAGRT